MEQEFIAAVDALIEGRLEEGTFKNALLSLVLGTGLLTGSAPAAEPVQAKVHQKAEASKRIDALKTVADAGVDVFRGVLDSGQNVKDLMLFTAVVESGGGKFTQQLRGGPATSVWQLEPTTATWLLQYAKKRPEIWAALVKGTGVPEAQLANPRPIKELLTKYPLLAAALARLKYATSDAKIGTTIDDHAGVWKKVYQAGGSKGLSSTQALQAYKTHTK